MSQDKKLVVFCGPSGAGKSTIARWVIEHFSIFDLSVSATTRLPRKGEEHGIHYYYLNAAEFEHRIAKNEFLEYEQVYEGLYYGTLWSEMDRIWAASKIPFLDLDVKGAAHLKERYKGNGLFVFIHPGSINELVRRLRARGTEDDHSIEKRIRRASFELEYADKFDYVLKNLDLETAQNEILGVVRDFIEDTRS